MKDLKIRSSKSHIGKIKQVDQIKKECLPFIQKNEFCCIYVLMKDGVPVYVGQTSNLEPRLLSHSKSKDFDSYWFEEVASEEASSAEARYIAELKPKLNGSLPQQDDVMTYQSAKKLAGGAINLRRKIKAGLITPISLQFGQVFMAYEVRSAFGEDSQ